MNLLHLSCGKLKQGSDLHIGVTVRDREEAFETVGEYSS